MARSSKTYAISTVDAIILAYYQSYLLPKLDIKPYFAVVSIYKLEL